MGCCINVAAVERLGSDGIWHFVGQAQRYNNKDHYLQQAIIEQRSGEPVELKIEGLGPPPQDAAAQTVELARLGPEFEDDPWCVVGSVLLCDLERTVAQYVGVDIADGLRYLVDEIRRLCPDDHGRNVRLVYAWH